ncbi:MAG: hypothetical protein HOG03_13735 [Desulfobacula sp.]|jgi:hypothetical protein|uniref:hypothetical protein n=1 Tax=Desulfobacula sp. TaxID=2593537 RepID=UPI001D325C9A|nr:hypothetical protein [Desulfobacula sp.]MBT4024858.1 hypothetical protein [Desulfobacula sp.]MBT6750150.1 hypothetical protein [Desulfobacula sp.]MBT7794780.1 hypothetical protein [Desulfobacula sp.]
MESIVFEKFGIDKCLHRKCDQQYNKDSIKLAVWLYGVIFLHEEKRHENADPILGPSKHEIMLWYEKTKGYIGITCPKCLKISFYKMRALDIKEFENFLNSWSIPNKNDQDTKKQSLSWVPELNTLNLRYYSPFRGTNAVLKDFCIYDYAYDRPTDTLEFFDDLVISVAGDNKDLENSFCSYNMTNKTEPAGTYIGIYWFDEKSIAEIINYENEKREKLFPRYHYFHDLMEKIDSLLKYNYYIGQQIDQALAVSEEWMKEDLRNYELHYRTKEDIEKRKKQIKIEHKKSLKLFNILISDPIELNPFTREPLKNCDYLWIKKNPFSGKGIPEDFSFGNQHDEDIELSSDMRNNHKRMVDLVHENFHKQYVQEFLKDSLIDFLKKYEGLIQFNPFSYAAVWDLKESYLKRLYKATIKGLSEDAPHVMKKEGKGWTIRFNGGKPKRALTDKGFGWIYIILSLPRQKIYYSALSDIYENKKSKLDKNKDNNKHSTLTEKIITSMENAGELSISTKVSQQHYADTKMCNAVLKKVEDTLKKIKKAERDGEFEKVRQLKKNLIKSKDNLAKFGIKWKIIKKTNKIIVQSDKFNDSGGSTTTGGAIKKSYDRALETIKPIDKDLYSHFTTYIHKEGGAFIYEPPEGFDWHLS